MHIWSSELAETTFERIIDWNFAIKCSTVSSVEGGIKRLQRKFSRNVTRIFYFVPLFLFDSTLSSRKERTTAVSDIHWWLWLSYSIKCITWCWWWCSIKAIIYDNNDCPVPLKASPPLGATAWCPAHTIKKTRNEKNFEQKKEKHIPNKIFSFLAVLAEKKFFMHPSLFKNTQ